MGEATNSNAESEETPKGNILATELKQEADNPDTTPNISNTNSKTLEQSNRGEEDPKGNILATELKQEADAQ